MKISIPRQLCVLASMSLLASCASSGPATPRTAAASPDRIAEAEIAATPGAQSAYDLVRRLRPRWLQNTAGTSSIGGGAIRTLPLAVYLDGNRIGGLEVLRSLSSSGVKTMQYYDAVRASTVLRQADGVAGAIVITTQ